MKRREFDIFGFLMGIIIGCVLGFFVSTRINPEDWNDEQAMGYAGNVYLLQIEKTDDEGRAVTVMNNIRDEGLNAVAVYSNDFYYIYGAIGLSEEELKTEKTAFESKSFSVLTIKEYLLDKPNAVAGDTEKFAFWTECVDGMFEVMANEPAQISEEYGTDPVNREIYLNFLALESAKNAKLRQNLILNCYKIIVEELQ